VRPGRTSQSLLRGEGSAQKSPPDRAGIVVAAIGQSVYFQTGFVLHDNTWQLDAFSGSPNITANGVVDFMQVVPEARTFTPVVLGAMAPTVAHWRK